MKQWMLAACAIFVLGLSGVKAEVPYLPFEMDYFDPMPASPAFSLKNDQGKVVKLADFKGKFIILNFFATWCAPCVIEMPKLEKLSAKLGAKTVLLYVNVKEDQKKVKNLRKKVQIKSPVLMDPEGQVFKDFGLLQIPTTLLIAPDGKQIGKVVGKQEWDDPKVLAYLNAIAKL